MEFVKNEMKLRDFLSFGKCVDSTRVCFFGIAIQDVCHFPASAVAQ